MTRSGALFFPPPVYTERVSPKKKNRLGSQRDQDVQSEQRSSVAAQFQYYAWGGKGRELLCVIFLDRCRISSTARQMKVILFIFTCSLDIPDVSQDTRAFNSHRKLNWWIASGALASAPADRQWRPCQCTQRSPVTSSQAHPHIASGQGGHTARAARAVRQPGRPGRSGRPKRSGRPGRPGWPGRPGRPGLPGRPRPPPDTPFRYFCNTSIPVRYQFETSSKPVRN